MRGSAAIFDQPQPPKAFPASQKKHLAGRSFDQRVLYCEQDGVFSKISRLTFLVSLAFLTLQFGTARAQTPTGTLAGVVLDASGAVVGDAEVKVTNEATSQQWTALSSSAGEFQFANLPLGPYDLEVLAKGFQTFRASKITVSAGTVFRVPVNLAVESASKTIVVRDNADEYTPSSVTIGNLTKRPPEDLPLSAMVITRSVLDDQQSRLLSDIAKNDAAVGEDYAPVGWYQDFMIRGFTLDLASGVKINGLSTAGEQLFGLENKESVEFLHGVNSDEVGVASGGGMVNYVTKRPLEVHRLNLATDQRGTAYGSVDLGGFFGAQQQFGVRTDFTGEHMDSYVHGANGWRALGAVAADWKIDADTYLKGDFEYQHLVQRSVGGYQLLGGTTVPTDVSPGVMLGYQPWAKPNTYNDFNTSIRLDHKLSSGWKFFVAADYSYTWLDDNIAWPYGCYNVPSCGPNGTPPYFFSATGEYDVYDYRSPGEVRINDQFEVILQGEVRTGRVTQDLAIGTSLQRRNVNLPNPVIYNYVGSDNIYLPEQTFQPSVGQAGPATLQEDTHQYALLVQDRIRLPGHVELTVGGQYDTMHDHNFCQAISSITGNCTYRATEQGIWLPQYAASWRPIQDVLLYGSYSVALSLGPQAPFWATVNPSTFLAPFFTRQVEAGVKYVPHQRVVLTAAVYRMRAPFFYPKVVDAAGDIDFLADGHETHRGLELNAQGKVTNWLRLTGSATFIDAISNGSSTLAFNDKQVIDVPHFRTSWFANIDVPFISGLQFLPGWSHSGPKAATRDGSVSVPGYDLLNLGARYTPRGEWSKVSFRLFADNVLNKRYWKDTGASYGDTFLHLGAPTTVRLSVQYDF